MARRGMLLSSVLGVVQSLLLIPHAFAESLPQAPPAAARHPLMVVEQHRASVVQRIVADWTDALATMPKERAMTPQQLSEALWSLRADRLLAASLAGSFTTIEALLAEDKAERAPMQRVAVKNLGDASADLAYTPISPCRIADTRAAGGALSPNVQRTFDGFNASSFAFQGGTATNCGMPNGVAAIAMNVYAVNPTNLGFIKVWPANGTEPAVSTVNYQTGIVAIATGAIVPVDGANSNRFDAKSPAAVDFIADVVGYFRAPPGTFYKQGGNAFGTTAVMGTTDANAVEVNVNGSRVMRFEPNAISPNVIGGNPANNATAGVRGATISGGGVPSGPTDPDFGAEGPNRVTDAYGTVAGGYANRAGNDDGNVVNTPFATVGGGIGNVASGYTSTVAGGGVNQATNADSAVGGGAGNVAAGFASTVPGGFLNQASGDYSFAAGQHATADAGGCFAFGGWSSGTTSCNGLANFIRIGFDHGFEVDYASSNGAGGGTRYVYVGDVFALRTISTWTGAYLSDAGVWVNASSSKTRKTDFAPVNVKEVLDRVAQLPITTWRYKEGEGDVRHMGPMAEDFWAAFQVGYGDHTIADLDARGVALAAIQGLSARVSEGEAALRSALQSKDDEIAALKDRVAQLEAATADENTVLSELAELRRAVEVLMARTLTEGHVAQAR